MNSTIGMSNNKDSSAPINPDLFDPDTVNLTSAKKHHGDLMELLDTLSFKLSTVSATVDKEFLSAYRVHMLTVQAELKNLKNDVSKGEQMLNSDAQVAKLEKESKWFSDECARLKQHFDAMTKDSKQMRQRLLDMAEQRNFLCDQLKALMKRNKVLEAEILQLKTGGDLQSLSISMGSASLLRSLHNHKTGHGHDDRSNGPFGKKNQLQHHMQQNNQAFQNQSMGAHSKVRFDTEYTGHGQYDHGKEEEDEEEEEEEEEDPMLELENDDDEEEDDELAYLQQRLRTQQLKQARQASAQRLSVAVDEEDDDDGRRPNSSARTSPSHLSRHASATYLQLPPPLQRAMASGRGDSLFNIRPTSSGGPNNSSSSPKGKGLRSSQSAVGLGFGHNNSTINNRRPGSHHGPNSPSAGGGNGFNFGMVKHAGMAQSLPVLPSNRDSSPYTNGQPKVAVIHQPTQQEVQERQRQAYKEEYEYMVNNRPVLEISLEEAIREIFVEVRQRKKQATMLCSTKRTSAGNNNSSINNNNINKMYGSPVGRGGGGLQVLKNQQKAQGTNNPWAMVDRPLSSGMQEIVQELNAQDDDIDPEPGSDGARLIKMTPTITQRGGIAGLGTQQFSENDRFAAVVKYLAQPAVFEAVTEKLSALFFPPTQEELRAAGQYLGNRKGHSSNNNNNSHSGAASPTGRRSRSNSPVAVNRR